MRISDWSSDVCSSDLVESTLVPVKDLTIQLSYTYLNAQIRKIDAVTTADPNYDPAISVVSRGSPLVLSPKHKFSITGHYTMPFDRRNGRVSNGLKYVYTDQQVKSYAYQNPTVLAGMILAERLVG